MMLKAIFTLINKIKYDHTNKLIFYTIIFAILFAISCATYNNSKYYSIPVAKVVSVSDVKVNENIHRQNLKLKIINNTKKDSTISVSKEYNKSLVYDEHYHTGDFVFLNKDCSHITGLKRDYIIVSVFLLLLFLILIFGGRQGASTVFCIIFNILIFSLLVKLNITGYNILLLTIASSFIFSCTVLLSINGLNKKFIISLFATIFTISFISFIWFLLIKFSGHINYEYLDYLPEPYTQREADDFFLSILIISALGAIIDVCVTITASAVEILEQNPYITLDNFHNSIKNIGDDITGTMINVLFFTNLGSLIPVFTISIENNSRFINILKNTCFFDIGRFLCGSIGILFAIPISKYAVLFFHEKGKKEIC